MFTCLHLPGLTESSTHILTGLRNLPIKMDLANNTIIVVNPWSYAQIVAVYWV